MSSRLFSSCLGWSKDIGRFTKGVTGGGGLEGGKVTGLKGMWKYLVVFGRSIVGIGAILFVCVGG